MPSKRRKVAAVDLQRLAIAEETAVEVGDLMPPELAAAAHLGERLAQSSANSFAVDRLALITSVTMPGGRRPTSLANMQKRMRNEVADDQGIVVAPLLALSGLHTHLGWYIEYFEARVAQVELRASPGRVWMRSPSGR